MKMNDEDIEQFMKAFEDFMSHAEVQELYAEGLKVYQKQAKKFTTEIERKAAEFKVTPNYYVMEFM